MSTSSLSALRCPASLVTSFLVVFTWCGAFTVDVVEIDGKVGYGTKAKGPWAEVTKGMTLQEGMFVRTGNDACQGGLAL